MNCLGLFLALTMHLGLESDYNNLHPHARCTLDQNIFGVYYNSESRISSYAGREFSLNTGKVELGLVTGYKSEDILPMVRYKNGNFFVSPAYETDTKKYGLVIGLEFGR